MIRAPTVPWRQRIDDDLPLWLAVAGDRAQDHPGRSGDGPSGRRDRGGPSAGDLTDIRDVFGDDIHPNGKGLYFIAMVHLAVLTGQIARRPAAQTDAQPGPAAMR